VRTGLGGGEGIPQPPGLWLAGCAVKSLSQINAKLAEKGFLGSHGVPSIKLMLGR
jgi:hypothetical protein